MSKFEYELLVKPLNELPLKSWFPEETEQRTMVDLLTRSYVCSIVINGSITGFFTFETYMTTVSFKIFVRAQVDTHENDLLMLLKVFCNENFTAEQAEYFTVAFFKKSSHFELNEYIDRTFRMEYTPESQRKCTSSSMVIVHSNDLDINLLKEFHYVCYAEDSPYMPGDWDKMLVNFNNTDLPSYSFSTVNKDKLSGVCIGMFIPHRDFKYLYSICVHPEYRNSGIGSALLDEFLKAEPEKPVVLNVFESAVSACNLYRKAGFVEKAVTSHIYKV